MSAPGFTREQYWINAACKHGEWYYKCKLGCWTIHAEVIYKLSHWSAEWVDAERAHKRSAQGSPEHRVVHAERTSRRRGV